MRYLAALAVWIGLVANSPAYASTVYYCNITDLTVIDLAGGNKSYRAKPFKMSVSNDKIVFGMNSSVMAGEEFGNLRRAGDSIWASGGRPDHLLNFFPPLLLVAGRTSDWVSFRAECDAFD